MIVIVQLRRLIVCSTSYNGPGLVVEADDDAGPGQSLQQAARLLAPVVPEVGQAPGQYVNNKQQ